MALITIALILLSSAASACDCDILVMDATPDGIISSCDMVSVSVAIFADHDGMYAVDIDGYPWVSGQYHAGLGCYPVMVPAVVCHGYAGVAVVTVRCGECECSAVLRFDKRDAGI